MKQANRKGHLTNGEGKGGDGQDEATKKAG
jgi:hypothetical protein